MAAIRRGNIADDILDVVEKATGKWTSNVLKFHPLANIFPLMDGKEYLDLVEDIRALGLRETIKLFDGRILDGRNRYRACAAAGVEPRFETFDGADPLAYIVSANLRRRQLNESARSMVAARLANMPEGKGGDRRSSANLRLISIDDAAEKLTVSPRLVVIAKTVLGFPELAAAVDHGLMRVSAAANLAAKPAEFQAAVVAGLKTGLKLTEAKRQARKEFLPASVASLPSGKYRVIYADPPWRYNDARTTEDHRESTGALDHYNDEDIDDLKELDVKNLAAPDSVLFCWATFPLLTDALEVVSAWGFKYKTAFVWDKGHGAFGHYHDADAELLLVATRGSCTPEAVKKEKQVQRFARKRHSAKPDEWRALIDRLYPTGPRIELFKRGACPKGWKIWGAEAAREKAA